MSFQREERYVVLKLKHMTEADECSLREFIHYRELTTVECVVIESGWNNHAEAWESVQRLTEGRESFADEISRLREEKDALAAWKHDAMRELTALQQVTHGLAHGGDMCWDYSRDAKAVMDREPATSLSRRDARVKAEAFSQAVALCVELRKGQESLEAKYIEIDGEGEPMVVRDGINYANKALGMSHCIDSLEGCAEVYRQQAEGEA